MVTLPIALAFFAGFAVTVLIVLLWIATGLRSPRKSRKKGRVLMRKRSHRPNSHNRQQMRKPHPPLPRPEIEKVFAEAENAAINSALGDLEAERNPYTPDSRPGVLWETHFNLVLMEWTGKQRGAKPAKTLSKQ